MSRNNELLIGPIIYNKIMAARLSEHERRVALNAMRNAEAIVRGLAWVNRAGEHVRSLFFKPSLKDRVRA
ncbi:MAG: hypothetical protein ACM3SS_03960 [Rhodospirillaceae bacterium]